jgi:hypothetical protein
MDVLEAFSRVPGRIFLDTCTVNFILDNDEPIFEGVKPSNDLNRRDLKDLRSLYNFFLIGERAHWQLAVSPFTYKEIMCTPDSRRKHHLTDWFNQIWEHWQAVIEENDDLPSFREAEKIRIGLLSSTVLAPLPDVEDRLLLCDAIVYHCDCFCTRDYHTVLKYRNQLTALPIQILSPTELWERIRPFASLWA